MDNLRPADERASDGRGPPYRWPCSRGCRGDCRSPEHPVLHRAPPPRPLIPRDWLKARRRDRKSTRLNSSHANISYAVFCLKKKKKKINTTLLTKNKKKKN